MSSMVANATRRSTLNTLKSVREPIFNKHYENVIDQLCSYIQHETNTPNDSSHKGGDSTGPSRKATSTKLVFMPTLQERISLDVA